MALAALLFCAPFLLCLTLNAGFLSLANEPLAYRFFYSERIFSGETVTVGVGYLISLLHHVVYAAMHLFPVVANGTLEARLDLFALLTNGLLSALLCVIFLLAIRSARSQVFDLALLALVALMPIYGTVAMGFRYAMMADYHLLNIVLCVSTLFIFQQVWRAPEAITRSGVILLGIFVGIAMANKLTMLVVVGVVLVPAVVAKGAGWREISIRATLASGSLIVSFFAVHLVSYLGSVSKMLTALQTWWAFASNPGVEPAFWSQLFGGFIQGYNYGYFIFYSVGILIFTIPVTFFRYGMNRQARLVTMFCALAFLACAYFIAKRPASSTLFESVMFSFTLTAVLLTVVSAWRPMRIIATLFCIAWFGFAAHSFSVSTVYDKVARSRSDSHVKWAVFDEVHQLAGTQPIEVIFPDNSFHHEGPFELLLKGAVDFPSWDITIGQKTILDRYAPRMSFRHAVGPVRPEMPYGSGRTLVWFDRHDTPPLETDYPELAQALSRPGVARLNRRMTRARTPAELAEALSRPNVAQFRQEYIHLTMHIAVIPEGEARDSAPTNQRR